MTEVAPTPGKRRLAIAAAIIGTVAAIAAIQAMVGKPARLVELVGLFAAAFTAGAGLVVAIGRRS